MKILLAALNAKFIHSNPAVYSLAAYCREAAGGGGRSTDAKGILFPDVLSADVQPTDVQPTDALPTDMPDMEIAEYTINQPTGQILADIYGREPDVLMFSCYIWNRREIESLVSDAGKIMPGADIWLGGPEVSFAAEKILSALPEARGVMRGEGEETFRRLAAVYAVRDEEGRRPDRSDLEAIAGITFRDGEDIVSCSGREACVDLDSIPFPYEDLSVFDNRIIYYESSRGCPFGCAYCLSSTDRHVRYRSMDSVKRELKIFLDSGVPQVKFVDRTFNCDRGRAMEIWQFLIENDNGITNFHFEIAGDIMSEEELELLSEARPGQFQFEIGVQSTNRKTLCEIDRVTDIAQIGKNAAAIRRCGNIHMHLDLIAGLPYEDYTSFSRSFDEVFAMEPDQLQLGFLKVLPGTPIEKRQDEYGIKHMALPPYEVLETRWISYGELIKLKGVEEMVEVYHNSGQFGNSLKLLIEHIGSPFRFFASLADWYERNGKTLVSVSRNSRYRNLLDFAAETLDGDDMEAFAEAMVFDYYMRDNIKTRPGFFGAEHVEKAFSKEFYSREAREHRYLSGGRYDTDDPRLLRKLTHLEKAGDKYYLFDYEERDPLNGNAKVTEIDARAYLERHTDLT